MLHLFKKGNIYKGNNNNNNMKRINTGTIKLEDIKHVENSRLKETSEVDDLMQDIKQRGLLENIGIRITDNALIFGNRRVEAFKKLGYKEISADFYDDVDDNELLITNLAENIKRKGIGSIEIGRICQILLEKNLTKKEIAVKIGITYSRVNSCMSAYNITKGTAFEKLVTFGERGGGKTGIPETLIWKVQNSLTRARKLTEKDWNYLLQALESGLLNNELITQLRKVLISSPHLSIPEALDVIKQCKVIHVFFHINLKELNKEMKKEKYTSEIELIKSIVRQYNKDLIF